MLIGPFIQILGDKLRAVIHLDSPGATIGKESQPFHHLNYILAFDRLIDMDRQAFSKLARDSAPSCASFLLEGKSKAEKMGQLTINSPHKKSALAGRAKALILLGDPKGTRTPVAGVRGADRPIRTNPPHCNYNIFILKESEKGQIFPVENPQENPQQLPQNTSSDVTLW